MRLFASIVPSASKTSPLIGSIAGMFLLCVLLLGCGAKVQQPSYWPNCSSNDNCPPGQGCINSLCTPLEDGGPAEDGGVPDGGAADGGLADGGAEDGGLADGGAEDGGLADGGPRDGGCGQFGEVCSVNSECCGLVCIDTTSRGSVCTKSCSQDCPQGWGCRGIQIGTGYLFVCFPEDDIYCRPCMTSYECGGTDDRCVFVVDGNYCLKGCNNEACPQHYNCTDVTDKEGRPTKACIPATATCEPCVPKTCTELGKECGVWHDGCLSMITCGPCPFPDRSTCDGSGKCQCAPNTCEGLNRECGVWPDGCGGELNCGNCPFPNISTCDVNGRCVYRCQSGYHSCGTQSDPDGGIQCYPDDDIEHCGDDNGCVICQAGDSKATVACINDQCSYGCQRGYHSCDTSGSGIICYPDDSLTHCGNDVTCTACSSIDESRSTAACLSGQCAYQCQPGYHACPEPDGGVPDGGVAPDGGVLGILCHPDTDITRCGPSCMRCEAGDAHALVACVNDQCSLSCKPGYHNCGTSGPNIKCYASDDTAHCGDDLLCMACQASDPNALATCVNGNCYYACQAGYHNCGTYGPNLNCYTSDDIQHCGDNAACTVCQSDDPHATVACLNGQCVFGCNPGYHSCEATDGGAAGDGGSACFADTDPSRCGASCKKCEAEDAHATVSCVNAQCAFGCEPGYHACGTTGSTIQCHANDDIQHCGDDTSCRLCETTQPNVVVSCVNGQCAFNCEPGYHACNQNDGGLDNDGGLACHPNSDTTYCGPQCQKCEATDTHATVACINDQCAFGCEPGYHSCGTSGSTITCHANDDIQHCGDNATCTACQAGDPHALATCVNGQCQYACEPGYHACGTSGSAIKCYTNDNVQFCGDNATCKVCQADGPNALATCVNGQCQYACQAGFHNCGTSGSTIKCYNSDDVQFCGDNATCKVCQAGDPNALVTCVNGQCQYACQAGFHNCGTTGSAIKCYTSDDVQFCGDNATCKVCQAGDPNALSTCVNGQCRYACQAGFHNCGTSGSAIQCHANDDVLHCGNDSACTICQAGDANAVVSCVNGQCTFGCQPGYHSCGTSGSTITCRANDDTDYCGTDAACVKCEAGDAKATKACVNNQCAYSCEPGYHSCGSTGNTIQCHANDDVQNCGDNTSCKACQADDPNALVTCVNGQCTFGCQPGYHSCATADGGLGGGRRHRLSCQLRQRPLRPELPAVRGR